MFRPLMICIQLIGLFVFAVSAIEIEANNEHRAHLRLICSGQWWPIGKLSEIRAFVGLLKEDLQLDNLCSQLVRDSLLDLGKILFENSANLCTNEKVDQLKYYYEKYVDSRADRPERIPKPVEFFFLAYGFQVSSSCKKAMITALLWESSQLLSREDFDQMRPWTDENSVIANVLDEPGDYDDLILPKDFIRLLNGNLDADENNGPRYNDAKDRKLIIELETLTTIEKIRADCAMKFRPIYRQVIIPLVNLANMGFNYQGEELERELLEMKQNKSIHQWYRIVYFCECLLELEFAETKRDLESSKGMPNKKVLSVLSHEDAELLRRANKLVRSRSVESLEKNSLTFKYDLGIQLEDQLIESNNKKLIKLIKNFNTHRDELDAIRARLFKKMSQFLIDKLKRGQLIVAMKTLLFGTHGSDGVSASGKAVSQTSLNQELIDQMDHYMVLQSDKQSKPMAGFGIGSMKQAKKIGGQVALYGKRNYQQLSHIGVRGCADITGRKFKDNFWSNTFWYIMATLLALIGIVSLCLAG